MTLPIVDLGSREAPRSLRLACEHDGFFYLVGHGLSGRLVREVQEAARAFFALPLSAKLALHFERTGRQRGYVPLRAEASDPAGGGDVKEALDFTHPVAPRAVSDPVAFRMYGDNLWPEELPGFRDTVETYLGEMILLGRRLFETIAVSVGLPPGYFAEKTDRPIAQLRLLHYPAGTPDTGIGAHCDYECFTLLEAGDVPGLEIEGRDGSWVPVPIVPGALTVNLGEMLARWTNDRYVATRHRVVNRSGRERFTIPFFFGTNYDTEIECLEPCRGPGRPARYPPVAAGAYLARRLHEVYGSLPGA